MIEICALASGSNGNSYYVGNETEAVLVDSGISLRQLMQRLNSRGLDAGKIGAVFLSHEHSDHSRGVRVLSKRLNVTVWMSPHTWNSLPHAYRPPWVQFFEPGEPVVSGAFTIHTFLKNHDAAEPCSFRIEVGGRSVGVFTDIGEPCDRVRQALRACRAIFLESNYDEKMLWEGSYPWPLKKRVASAVGHLSNLQALTLLQEEAPPGLECVFLSHLSQENNTPATALGTMDPLLGRTTVKLTSRYEASDVYRLQD